MGTSGCRAVIFDENFAVAGRAAGSYPLLIPRPQWAEQDADQVLSVTLAVIRQCLRRSGVPSQEILGMGLSGVLYTVLAIDGQGRPLLPLIQWSDNRAGPQAERLDPSFREGNLYQRTGCRNHSMYLPAKILWIKEEMPS
ncbi:MAG: FGGY family carbohydrate kinase, partial [candidate division NC10 bacterium]|nr:FGGY family carbohydrate kinase [candidate division NC10 bacterium]